MIPRLLSALLFLTLPVVVHAGEITVLAASSLKTALDPVARAFEKDTGHKVTVGYGGTSALARQIEQGAPADVFLAANPGWMDALDKASRLAPGTRRDLLTNRLVLISHVDGPAIPLGRDTDLAGLLGQGRLAVALVEAVPAGIYAKAALQSLDLWQQAEPQLAQAKNVRAALALVATGAAPFGITYATDARAEPRVHVRATFPADSHPPIIYPVAAIRGGDVTTAQNFLDYLATPRAQAAFSDQGFGLIPAGG